jgi:8-oxo-dGTP pyrophosphatase MutT (NUDIX family)
VKTPQPTDDALWSLVTTYAPLIAAPDVTRRQAAVLIPLFKNAVDYHVVFTKRTDTLRHHKGQISFPGGSFDPADGDLLTTALRESHEELGIAPGDVTILGRLDDLTTFSTNFIISPFVGLIPHPYEFRPNAIEVAIVFDVPLSTLADPAVSRSYVRTREDGATLIDYEFYVGDHVIWGATARIIRHLLTVITREVTRTEC